MLLNRLSYELTALEMSLCQINSVCPDRISIDYLISVVVFVMLIKAVFTYQYLPLLFVGTLDADPFRHRFLPFIFAGFTVTIAGFILP